MNIHAYREKQTAGKAGVATPRGFLCFSADEVVGAAEETGGSVWIVKSSMHAGIGPATHGTGPEGRLIQRLLTEASAGIKNAMFRHPGIAALRDTDAVAAAETDTPGFDFTFNTIALDGQACLPWAGALSGKRKFNLAAG